NSLSISRGACAVSTGVSGRIAERRHPGAHWLRRAATGAAASRGPLVQSPQFRWIVLAGVDRDHRSSVGVHSARSGLGAVVDSAVGEAAGEPLGKSEDCALNFSLFA